MQKDSHLFLVDGSGFIYRSFYATPFLNRKQDGLPVNAIAGFCNMLWKLLQNSRMQNIASHFAVVFDHSEKTFRNEIYPGYKANRPPMPEMLIPQLPLVRLATEAFGIPSIEIKGFEADDIIATYACLAEQRGFSVTIISTDKDLMQIISPNICMYDAIKEKKIDVEGVMQQWGIPPEKMVCLQALAGDSADNIPGVPGIGYKTATSLIQEYGDIDEIIANANQIKQKKRRESILENIDALKISLDLVTLRTDVPVTIPLDDLVLETQNGPKLISFLKGLEFTRLTKRIAKVCDCDADSIEPECIDTNFIPLNSITEQRNDSSGDVFYEKIEDKISNNSPQSLFLKRAENLSQNKIKNDSYTKIVNIEELKTWIKILETAEIVSFKIITNIADAFNSKPIGISFSIFKEDAFMSTTETITAYIPLIINNQQKQEKTSIAIGLTLETVLVYLKDFFETENVLKVGHNIKYDKLVLYHYGVIMRGFDDVMLISYVLDSGRSSHNMQYLSKKWLSYDLVASKELLETRKLPVYTADTASDPRIAEYATDSSNVILKLWFLLKLKLIAEKLLHVYERLEKPIIDVVTKMEIEGIRIDEQLLLQLSHELSTELTILEEKIYIESGEKFNISSPKQLGDILFTKLKLPGGTKTKRGQWKTTAQDLEQIDCGDSPLISYILEWRQISKIKSTYADSLPKYINQKTQRVHTFYSLASTMTGRLASLEPNLQNIPIKTYLGRKIRKAFITSPHKKLISADYSQIELRILAHIAQIKPLCQAFKKSFDIHTITASEIFGVNAEEVSPDMRRRAKTINFSIIYGISPFRLAHQLKIKRYEATDYIQRYFDRFPGIRDYIEQTKIFVRKNGYVETIFGRRIHYNDINSPKTSIRNINERAAINAPIQGSAADITRRAMIKVQKSLDCHKMSTKMLLQIHDELVFEAPEEEVLQVSNLITEAMESATFPKINLIVPLKVDIKIADNWQGTH
ncbi:MAG: DNA polymerase I [Candidatus Liberibacter europaeus]|uniref:DNA polymerase I n=1 Tax=Candidatus Liberibacter europaeus TaxID=744859 RepID=A0A2T4VY23_9HYPH|nr:DNA polymerase I [Candidatus Liberibacter europaeus]PTL86665.1 MAG: DNA polymerase I [Candidatus Liberibacter europaeus]